MARGATVRAGTVARKAQILDAALACFTDVGIEATTIDDIRRHAGCSTGSIYHHFGSKEGIASALYLDAAEQLNADLMRKLTRCRTAEQAVKTVVTQYSDWVTRHRDLAGFLLNSREVAMTTDARSTLRANVACHTARRRRSRSRKPKVR